MNAGSQAPDQLFGKEVMGSDGKTIGKVDGVWVDDATNELEFVAVKTGLIMGKNHIIPAVHAQIADGTLTVPYAESQIKDAPSYSSDQELTPDQEDEIYRHYGVDRSTSASPSGLPSGEDTGRTAGFGTATDSGRTTGGADTGIAATEGGEQTGMTLSEEELQVGTRQVESGRVRLRKVVRTEQQEVPVELRREHVQVERVDASGADVPGDAFQEQEIEVPVMREESVVSKESRVTGGVQVRKDATTETQTVGDEVRKEDVEVDDSTHARRTDRGQ